MSALSQLASMHNVSAEKRFAAVMVASAVEEAQAGDAAAVAWLEHCSLSWIEWICPGDVSPTDVHQALLDGLPNVRADGINRLAMQLDLLGLEAA